jgi:nicotinamidase-related amidase
MSKNIHLLVIDPQNSFCKVVDPSLQQVLHDGELCVTGAWEDMAVRLPVMIDRLGKKLDDLHVTLDSHHSLHVAHPGWYRDSSGNQPAPYTFMRAENGSIIGSTIDAQGNKHDIGEFTCVKPSVTKRTLAYLTDLQASGRYPHIVWPMHCLIGTPGHNVVAPLMEAMQNWCRLKGDGVIDFVTKGSNPFVEHFSAVRAEVVDPNDHSTDINKHFITTVNEADIILLAGEALSHCLANTVRDMANFFPGSDEFIKKCVLLTDATSSVPGFESFGDNFITDMTARGMKTSTTVDFLA